MKLEDKCMWYRILKTGVTFKDRDKSSLICYQCNGTKERADKLGCGLYIVDTSNKYKQGDK